MQKLKIAIQGIPGSFHDAVAHKYFGENIETVDCPSFKLLCERLQKEEVNYGVMAIENTIAGSILPNYALIREYHLRIIGEVYHHIQMNLMALPGVKVSDLKYVHSHPMAIYQCVEYLQTLPSEVRVIEKSDTAESAKDISDAKNTETAAIASLEAAEIYGLDILEKGIETNKKNYTRFVIVSLKNQPSEQANKASVSFEVGHLPGSLAKVLNILAEYNINLTKIQSVPVLGRPYEYSFHADILWDDTEKYERAIHYILKNVSSLAILGEYPRGDFMHS